MLVRLEITIMWLHPEFYSPRSNYIWLVDQAWGQDDWILVKLYFCMFTDQNRVKVYKQTKKKKANMQQYSPNMLSQYTSYYMW